MLGYGLLGVGALVMILLGVVKFDHIRIDSLKTQVATAKQNEKLAVDANASLKASCDKAIAQYKEAQDKCVKQAQANAARAAATKAATKVADPKSPPLEATLASPAKTKQEQCDAAIRILHDIAVDSVRQ